MHTENEKQAADRDKVENVFHHIVHDRVKQNLALISAENAPRRSTPRITTPKGSDANAASLTPLPLSGGKKSTLG